MTSDTIHTEAPAVPAPACCAWCKGTSCEVCGSTGVAPVSFALSRTHTYAVRVGTFAPLGRGRGLLEVLVRRTTGGVDRVARYRVSEFACDFAGRAFDVLKVGDGEARRVFLGADGSATCSCAAGCYAPTHKANERARDEQRETVVSAGCVHADSLRALLAAGYLDLSGGCA